MGEGEQAPATGWLSVTFAEFLHSLGLRPGVIAPDGKWRRCRTEDKPRKRNGAYVLDERGGAAINYATMTERALWRPDGATDVPEYDPRALDAARREQRRKLVEATRAAVAFWEGCKELRGGHAYLERKGLDMAGARGLRVDRDGWLVIPAKRDGSLVSYQRIAPDGQKLFAPGASMKGAVYVLERLQPTIHIVCEGLATGLALYAAVPHSRIIVAFTAGGLLHAAEQLPGGFSVVASDNDHRTVCQKHRQEGRETPLDALGERPEWCTCNPGVTAALNAAAHAFSRPVDDVRSAAREGRAQSGVAIPKCADGGTDWNDYRLELTAGRLEAWNRKKHETDARIRKSVDTEIAMQLQRAAVFRAPKVEG